MPSDIRSQFVSVKDGQFVLNDQPYRYVGVNMWQAMHLGSAICGDRTALQADLDLLSDLGVDNIRLMVGFEGPTGSPWRAQPALQEIPARYTGHLWEGLDFVLDQLSRRSMKAVLCLNNFWPWSGGMAQYVSWVENSEIPYPPPAEDGSWLTYMMYASQFYHNQAAMELYHQHVKLVINRKNSINGVAYKEDPTIMSWQLANEPRGILRSRAMRNWIHSSASLIKRLDDNHLVSIGSEGSTSSRWAGNRFVKDHRSSDIDYTTAHVWVENWGWYDPTDKSTLDGAIDKAMKYISKHAEWSKTMNKPFVLEEFGMARDHRSYDPASSVVDRNAFLKAIIDHGVHLKEKGQLSGINIWGWAGSKRPTNPGGVWESTHEFIGDPPHEFQGWYSIYDSDLGTLDILRDGVSKIVAKEE